MRVLEILPTLTAMEIVALSFLLLVDAVFIFVGARIIYEILKESIEEDF